MMLGSNAHSRNTSTACSQHGKFNTIIFQKSGLLCIDYRLSWHVRTRYIFYLVYIFIRYMTATGL